MTNNGRQVSGNTRGQRGFSLLEMMMVVLILSVVTGIVVKGLSQLQVRNNVETSNLDLTQETRSFMDQLVRDLHETGYPTTTMFTTGTINDATVAVGLVKVTPNLIQYEGDLDGTGQVQSVTVQLVTGAGGACPCTLQRGAVLKATGSPLTQAAPTFYIAAENVINSNSVYAISGNTPRGTTNDSVFAVYKPAPVFAAFDVHGNPITLPLDISTVGPPNIKSIKTITITVSVLSPNIDLEQRTAPVISMQSEVKINN